MSTIGLLKPKKRGKPFQKGHVPWIKGKTMSEEFRQKISKSKKGQTTWMKGKKHKASSKKKVSITKKQKSKEQYDAILSKSKKLLQKIINDDIIIGALLSDAYLRKGKGSTGNTNFAISQTIANKGLITFVKKHLLELGFKVKTRKSDRYDKRTRKTYHIIVIWTPNHPVWGELRKIWYPKGKKIVPKYARKVLAVWFAGDGHSSWIKKGIKNVQMGFATNSFFAKDVKRLKKLFEKMGFHPWIQKVRNKKIKPFRKKNSRSNRMKYQRCIIISNAKDVKKFMIMIKPTIKLIPGFTKKKIKIPLVQTMSEAKTGIPNPNKGKPASPAAKKNILIAQKKRRRRERKKYKNVKCYDCGSHKTYLSKTNFPMWHQHRSIPSGKFLCAKCYTNIMRK